jgi:hypothetical protein
MVILPELLLVLNRACVPIQNQHQHNLLGGLQNETNKYLYFTYSIN